MLITNPFFYIDQRLKYLEQEMTRLRQENASLIERIDQLKPTHIEKIEYKIHELHVETLSGTLNIGLTANGDDSSMGEVIEKIIDDDNDPSQEMEEKQEEQSS